MMSKLFGILVVVAGGCFDNVNALANGAGLIPPMGWSSWCTAGKCGADFCDEVEVLEAADALNTSGMLSLGYNYIVLDDCWAGGSRDAVTGELQADLNRFPRGMAALADDLHRRGIKFGLYTSAGNQTCSSGGRAFPIPGSEGHYQQDANTFAAWGIDYVKLDWCGDVKHLPIDGVAKGRKYYESFSHAINDTSPLRSMFFSGVAAYIFLLGDAPTYTNAWRSFSDHHDVWSGMSGTATAIIAQQDLGTAGRPGAWPDMDVLTTGGQACATNSTVHCPGQTDVEYMTEFSLWVMNQSPLMVATDIRNMTAIMKKVLLNAELTAIHQDTQTPPAKHVGIWPCSSKPLNCQLWARPMADGSLVVALLNTDSKAHKITLEYTRAGASGWDADTNATVYDLWEHAVVGSAVGQVEADVVAHGTAVLRLSK